MKWEFVWTSRCARLCYRSRVSLWRFIAPSRRDGCNENKCVTLLHVETGEEIGMCTFEKIVDHNCKNVNTTGTCKFIQCA